MVRTKITRPMDGELNGRRTKITSQRDGRHKNNSPKGWMDGWMELYGRNENNSPKDGELNAWHKK